MAEKPYRRLTRERTVGRIAVFYRTRSSLWLGSDHLLFVENVGYTENYKRFYFRDIQAIGLRVTQVRLAFNVILGILLGLSFAIGIAASQGADRITIIIWVSAVCLLFGLPLLLNNIFGPTCTGFLRTAVQTEELPSLCRLPQSRKLLAKIMPLIIAAQGQLGPEEVAARMRELAAPRAESASPYVSSPASPLPPIIS